MERGLPVILALLLSCQRTPQPAPDPAAAPSVSATTPVGPVEATQILKTYAQVDLDKLPDTLWAGKTVRISGHVAKRWPDEGAAKSISLGTDYRGIECGPAEEGQPTAHVGDVVVVEGEFRASKYQPRGPAGVPLAPDPRLLLEVVDCKLVSAHRRSFGVTAAASGARVMPIAQFLKDVGDAKLRASMIGKAFAVEVQARVVAGYVELRSDVRDSDFRCPVPVGIRIFQRETVMFAGTLAKEGSDAGEHLVLKDCRPVDP